MALGISGFYIIPDCLFDIYRVHIYNIREKGALSILHHVRLI
jgi:hypothetical protein